MKCLVTGCAGFIGSHIAQRLLVMGHEVTGIDCLSDYYSPAQKRANLDKLFPHKGFHFIGGDLLQLDLPALVDGQRAIFHEAAQAGVRASWGRDFDAYTSNNVLATQRLLEACKGSEALEKLVYASSSSVYGDAERYPTSEDDIPRPFSPYGVTKLASENLCMLYQRNFGVPAVALRYFTVYGPRQRPDMGFNKFIRAMLKSQPITLYGDGEQTRDFTYVDDIVDANLLALQEGTPGRAYNIGGGSRVTVNHILALLQNILGREAIIHRELAQVGDVHDTGADILRAMRELGYCPKVGLYAGLSAQAAWQQEVTYA